MIFINYETGFILKDREKIMSWIEQVVHNLNKELGTINYIFCDDSYLLSINQKYLQHDTYTDIISFDYSEPPILSGDIFISIERVQDNAKTFKVSFDEELRRVILHGILHYAGFNDKTQEEKTEMRKQENTYLDMYAEHYKKE